MWKIENIAEYIACEKRNSVQIREWKRQITNKHTKKKIFTDQWINHLPPKFLLRFNCRLQTLTLKRKLKKKI